jgi:deaminated glutathione amidase
LSSELRVAAVQMTSGADTATNVERAHQLVSVAAGEGATYVQLPELFNYLGPSERYRDAAEPIPGPTTKHFARLAQELGVTLHLGSMLETSPDSERCFNTSVVIDPSGEIAATYRKIHLFDIDVPGEVFFNESARIAPGDEIVVFGNSSFALGLTICFDLRFPELFRTLALRGATVLAIPSAFNAITGAAHWDVLVRARAIENHAFVVAAAQAGTTVEGIETYGHSIIVGPWGETLAESETDGEDVLVVTLSLEQVAQRRSQIDVLRLHRVDL